jgi:hypothetical protein
MMEELKKEEAKYRELYERGSVLDGLKADAFKMAIEKLNQEGLDKTYSFFKQQRDKYSNGDKLSRNLSHAYGLVVSKLWKYKVIK